MRARGVGVGGGEEIGSAGPGGGAGRWVPVGARVGREAISGYPPAEVFSGLVGGTAKVQRRSKAASS